LEKFEMKKTLVAIAAVVATTGAMAEATLTGSVQAGSNSTSYATSGSSAVNTLTFEDSNGNTVFNIGDTEDLGGGLMFKGNIAVETGLFSTSVSQGNGVNETYASLTGGFGGIKVGALQTPQFQAIAAGDAGGGLLISNLVYTNNTHQGSTTGSNVLLQSKSFQYTTPTFVDGLSLKYQLGAGAAANNAYNANHYAADYKTGAFAAGIAYSTYKLDASTTDKATTYYATYDMGVAKIQALWGKAETSGSSDVNSTSIGFQVPMGAATFMYNHSSSDGRVYNTTTQKLVDDRLVSTVAQAGDFIGVSYALSKRTTAYAAFYKETGNDAQSTTTGIASGSTWNTTRFIVIHSF
jgi:predicted porin